MCAKGFSATTVEEICKAAKLTKGSFFHYFKSKEGLGKELLERFCAATRVRLQALCPEDPDPLKRAYGAIETAIALSRECDSSQGCLLGTFAQELSDTHPQMRALCAKAFTRWVKALKRDLDAAKARYAPRAAFETKSLAEHFIAILEGSKILARTQQDGKVVERNLRHFRAYLEGLFGR